MVFLRRRAPTKAIKALESNEKKVDGKKRTDKIYSEALFSEKSDFRRCQAQVNPSWSWRGRRGAAPRRGPPYGDWPADWPADWPVDKTGTWIGIWTDP